MKPTRETLSSILDRVSSSLKGASAVDRIAHELRAAALEAEQGGYLGSEEGLSSQFDISAPTLRQAARLLEHEGLLQVKRGVRGGYYAARPEIATVTRVAATYLRFIPGSQDDIGAVMQALWPLIISLVIESDDIGELEEFVRRYDSETPPPNVDEIQAEFAILMMNLPGNSILHLIWSIVFQYGMTIQRQQKMPFDGTFMNELWYETMAEAKAILARDKAAAVEHARKRGQLISGAVKQNLTIEKEVRAKARKR